MTQTIRPIATLQATNWTPVGAATIHAALSDATDTTYADSANNPDFGDLCTVQLADPGLPGSGNHNLFYRIGKSATAGRTINFQVRLFHGTTLINTWNHADVDAIVEFDQLWTPPSGIDWGDLRVTLEAEDTGGGAGRTGRIYDVWAIVPAALDVSFLDGRSSTPSRMAINLHSDIRLTGRSLTGSRAALEISFGEFDPANLVVTPSGELSWDPSPGDIIDYQVFRRTPQTGEPFNPTVDTPVATGITATSWTDESVESGDYDYQVYGRVRV
jgi:hypothetical protein